RAQYRRGGGRGRQLSQRRRGRLHQRRRATRGTVIVLSKSFNAVKVFSATMFQDRERLGDKVSDWIASHPESKIADVVVTQSSDASFHCIAITVFYTA
ncbi:MAG TPA: hypothetical protein VLT45_13035, partial [Kofleriaceae bacterium]|nr:hypothetical protein [Kofleriaceae bacterium]